MQLLAVVSCRSATATEAGGRREAGAPGSSLAWRSAIAAKLLADHEKANAELMSLAKNENIDTGHAGMPGMHKAEMEADRKAWAEAEARGET